MTRNDQPSAGLGILTLVLTLVGWSSVPLFLRHFADLIDFWTSNGWRYGFSALVWAPVLVIFMLRPRNGGNGRDGGNGIKVQRLPRGLWKAALVPSIANAAGQICFTWAHYRIEPGLVTFGLRTQLLFVAIGAWIMFPTERAIIRRPGYIFGATILLIGMAVVMLLSEPTGEANELLAGAKTGQLDINAQTAHLQGIMLAIASGLFFACYGLAVRKYMTGINSVVAFAAICQYTALVMVALMLILGKRGGMTVLDFDGEQMIMLLGSALIGIAIGHVFYYFSIARLGVAITAGVLQLQPFLVAIGSLYLFNERLNGWQWMGGTVAVAGAMLMLSVQWRASQKVAAFEEPVAIAEGESGS